MGTVVLRSFPSPADATVDAQITVNTPIVPAVEDILNQALGKAGQKRRIGDIYDGSDVSNVSLEIYGQTRDELIRAQSWPWARRSIALTLLKDAPAAFNPNIVWDATYAPPGWGYEYAYPPDCLEFLAIARQPGLMPSRDPKPALWRIDNDYAISFDGGNTFSAARVILANIPLAIGVYKGEIIDPATWDVGFTALLIGRLAEKFDEALGQRSPDTAKTQMAETQVAAATADRHRG